MASTRREYPIRVSPAFRAYEVRGAVELPKLSGLKPGDHVKILGGPFRGHLALYAGMKSHQRVEVLLALLGSQQRAILPRADVEALATSGVRARVSQMSQLKRE